MKYYIIYNDENKGPLEIEELIEFGLNPKSRIWAPGWTEWKDADQVEEIMQYLYARESKLREAEQAASQANTTSAKIQNGNSGNNNLNSNNARQESQSGFATPHWQTATSTQTEQKPQQQTWATSVNGANAPGASSSAVKGVEWYIAVNNEEVGPVPEYQLPEFGLSHSSLVWCESLTNWTPASQVPALQHLLTNANTHQYGNNTAKQTQQTPVNQNSTNQKGIIPFIMPLIGTIAYLLSLAILSSKFTWLSTNSKVIYISSISALPVILLVLAYISAGVSNKKGRHNYDPIGASRNYGYATAYSVASILYSLITVIFHFVE